MSTRAVQKKNNGSATPKSKHKHPLRIVPTHPFARDASAPAPHLTYRNGPLLTSVEVFTVFWGKAWQEPANDILPGEVNSFFDFILTSSLIDQLAEYSVPDKSIFGLRTSVTRSLPAVGRRRVFLSARISTAAPRRSAGRTSTPR